MIQVTAEIVSNLIEVTAEIVIQVINVGSGGTIYVYADNELQDTIVSPNLNAEVLNIIF